MIIREIIDNPTEVIETFDWFNDYSDTRRHLAGMGEHEIVEMLNDGYAKHKDEGIANIPSHPNIDDLADALSLARIDEANAREKRIEAEEAIIAQFQLGETERKTIKTNTGLKLTIQSGVNYKLAKGYDPEKVPTKETVKVELDRKAYEELHDSDPMSFAAASKFVTVTPKKTSVTVSIK